MRRQSLPIAALSKMVHVLRQVSVPAIMLCCNCPRASTSKSRLCLNTSSWLQPSCCQLCRHAAAASCGYWHCRGSLHRRACQAHYHWQGGQCPHCLAHVSNSQQSSWRGALRGSLPCGPLLAVRQPGVRWTLLNRLLLMWRPACCKLGIEAVRTHMVSPNMPPKLHGSPIYCSCMTCSSSQPLLCAAG